MATTIGVFDENPFIPKPKYQYILAIDGIDSFLIKEMEIESPVYQPSFFGIKTFEKSSNVIKLRLGAPLTANAAKNFHDFASYSMGSDTPISKPKEFKKLFNCKNIMIPFMVITTKMINKKAMEKSDIQIKKIDPIGAVTALYAYKSCFITSYKIEIDNKTGLEIIDFSCVYDSCTLVY